MRLLFCELDRHWWPRSFITGPNQDGKTLALMVILCYILFELRQTTIFGVPSLDVVEDKWKIDLLPIIKASRYAELLPRAGGGSRDGASVLIQFRNDVALRFMTAGGDDQSRAAFTSQNLLATETDGFDEVGGSSREGDKFSQLERRLLAFGARARVIGECTVTTEAGRTWQEYQLGTQSRIVLKCPHCQAWVTPEREHLVGWQEAQNELEAAAKAELVCPSCAAVWTNEQRIEANQGAMLLHRGQAVENDRVVGDLPRTNTLGFRWTCVNSILSENRLAIVAGKEWRARRAADEEAADRDVRQSEWAMPSKPAKSDVRALDYIKIMHRTLPRVKKGFCPPETEFITVGCDVHKRLLQWVALAWRAQATPHIIDYGVHEVQSEIMGEEAAILTALQMWRDDTLLKGWDRDGSSLPPAMTFVDAGNWQEFVVRFCQDSGDGFFAVKSFGATQKRSGGYKRDTGTKVIEAFDHYSLLELPNGDQLLEVNADHWKSWVQGRLVTPLGQPGAMTLYDLGDDAQGRRINDHLSIAKHLISERPQEEFVPGQGIVTRWFTVSPQNHKLDATMLASVAGHAMGARLIQDEAPEESTDRRPSMPPAQSFANNWRGRY